MHESYCFVNWFVSCIIHYFRPTDVTNLIYKEVLKFVKQRQTAPMIEDKKQ
jgi:hypothetical protein